MSDPYSQGLPCLNPHCASHGKSHPRCKCYGPGGPASENMAEGGEVGGIEYCRYGFPHHAGCEYAKGGKAERQEGMSIQGHDVRQGDMEMAKEEAKGRAREERHVRPNIQGLADGGQAPVPSQGGDSAPQDQKKTLHDVGTAASGGVNKPTLDPRSWWSEGGEVNPKLEQSKKEPPKQDSLNYNDIRERKREMNHEEANKPVMPKKRYAEGGDVDAELGGDPGVDAPPMEQPYQPTHTPMQTDTPTPETKSFAQQELEEDHKYAADLDAGHIQPKTYQDLWNDKSTPGKISTLFGVLAAGMGSGLTHQPNAVMQMMDNVINRDIDAQKTSAQNKQNHWNLNYQHALETAQANGMDANSDHTREQTKQVSNLRTKMQADRNALAGLSAMIKNMPEGPQKQQASDTFGYLARGVNADHINMAQQYDAKNQQINGKLGINPNSTITNPAPEVRKPVPSRKGASNAPPPAEPQSAQAPAPPPPEGLDTLWGTTRALFTPQGQKELGDWQQASMDAAHKKYLDERGSGTPRSPTPRINNDAINRALTIANSTPQDQRGPKDLTDQEKALIPEELDRMNKTKAALDQIHKVWPDLMRYSGGADMKRFMDAVGESSPLGFHLPKDMGSYSPDTRRFAASLMTLMPILQQAGSGTEGAVSRMQEEFPISGTESKEEMLKKLELMSNRLMENHYTTLERRGLFNGWKK